MPVLRRYGFGEITSVTKADGTAYEKDADRLTQIGRPGLVLFYESFHRCPGQYFLYLYPYCADNMQTYFHSSCGNLSGNVFRYTLKTAQSIYTVKEDPMLLSADQKMDVLLNSGTITKEEGTAIMEECRKNKNVSAYSIYVRRMTRNLPESLYDVLMDEDSDNQVISDEIEDAFHDGSISPDQARYLNNKYVNFSRHRTYYYI